MNRVQVLVVGMFSLLVVACGGGGGGGGSGQVVNANAGPQQVTYSGVAHQAAVTQKNAVRFASNAYSLLDLMLTLADFQNGQRPWFLDYEYVDDIGSGECASGDVVVREDNSSASAQATQVLFRGCVIDGVRFDGQIDYRTEELLEAMSISYLSVEDVEEKLELQGSLELSLDGESRYAGKLIANSRRQQRSFKIEELTMQGGMSATLAGRFYDSAEGWVGLGLDDSKKELGFLGSDATRLRVIPDVELYGLGYAKVKGFDLELVNAALFAFPLRGQMSVEDFMEWPYLKNDAPAVVGDGVLSVDRLAKLTFDGSDYFQDSHDLLSFRFSEINDGDLCPTQQRLADFDQVEFQFKCKGEKKLVVVVSDGQNEIRQVIDIDVLPLAAELAPVADQSLTEGQSLFVPVIAGNKSEDGPFVFSIVRGPSGISVSADGVVQGEPKPFLAEGATRFKVTVQADNGKKSNINFEIDYAGPAGDLQFTPVNDERWQMIGGQETRLFGGEDDSPILFVSSFGRHQVVELDGRGNINDVVTVNQSELFGATSVAQTNEGSIGGTRYLAVVPNWKDVIIDEGQKRYTVRHYYYEQFNAVSGEKLSSVEVPASLGGPIISGDANGDGVLDFFVPNRQGCSAWYIFGSSLADQVLQCSGGLSPSLVSDIRLIDLNGDGTDEAIILTRMLLGGFNLRVYRYFGNQLQLVVNYDRLQYGSLITPVMGVQDIDADGLLEIVVAEKGENSTRISQIEQSGEVREVTTSELIDNIPDIQNRKSNASLIAASSATSGNVTTHFIEIGLQDGSLVWKSQPYAGRLLKNGLHVLGTEAYSGPVIAITDAGFLRF